MESNKDEIKASLEKQKKPDFLKIGDTFELPDNKIVLLGRADDVVEGTHVYKIEGLKNNLNISNYALELMYDPNEHQRLVSKPNLNIKGTTYKGKNKIIIDTRDNQIEVEDTYGSNNSNLGRRGGTVIDQIIVGDEEMKNGFILMAAGNNRFKLTNVISEGKNL